MVCSFVGSRDNRFICRWHKVLMTIENIAASKLIFRKKNRITKIYNFCYFDVLKKSTVIQITVCFTN